MSDLTAEEKRTLKNAKERENWKKRRMKVLESLGLDPNRPVQPNGKRGQAIHPSSRHMPDEFRFPKEGETEEEFKKRNRKEIARRYNEKHKERLAIERRAKYAANNDHELEVKRKWREANPNKLKEYSKRYLDKNPERLDSIKKWRKDNPEIAAEKSKQWFKNNPHMNAAYASKRRAAERQQTPSWANWDEITKIFRARDNVAKATKAEYHVDHIVPLRSKKVSGLHIHQNLQILPGSENLKKRARLDEEYIISLMKKDWESVNADK